MATEVVVVVVGVVSGVVVVLTGDFANMSIRTRKWVRLILEVLSLWT